MLSRGPHVIRHSGASVRYPQLMKNFTHPTMPQPLDHLVDHLFHRQRIISSSLQAPQTSFLVLLTLSRPISSVLLGDDEDVAVLEFFGLFWVLEVDSNITGFFTDENAAIRHVQQKRYEGVFKASQNSSRHRYPPTRPMKTCPAISGTRNDKDQRKTRHNQTT